MRGSSILLTILCGPCVCIYVGFTACFCPGRLSRRRSEPEDKKRFERRQRHAPRPLVVRKRALTIPLPSKSDLDLATEKQIPPPEIQKTLPQMQSRLLALPLELREMIYKYVLGDNVLHIIHKENKLGHLRCKAKTAVDCPKRWYGEGPCSQSCWGVVDSSNIWMPVGDSLHHWSDGDILPFLQTCRQVYSEAVPILYSTNTFSFIDLDCFRYLSATILPSRFQAIKKLEIEWYLTWPIYDDFAQRMLISTSLYPPHDEATWEEIWRIIAGMSGLQKLRVELNYFDGFRDDECENKMLAPLRQVKGVKDFVVNLGWSGKEVTGASFKVERPVVVGVDESDEDW